MLHLQRRTPARPVAPRAVILKAPPLDTAWRRAQVLSYSGGAAKRVRSRTFTGLTAVVKDVQIDGDFEVACTAPFWRLTVMLEEVGGRLRVVAPDRRVAAQRDLAHAMFLAPPGSPLRAVGAGLTYVRKLSLQFDAAVVGANFPGGQIPGLPSSPCWGFSTRGSTAWRGCSKWSAGATTRTTPSLGTT
jgi:hypothetical protein